ncbi:MAG: PaaI family thioesterase [Chloroflexota bacterium]
MQPMERFVRGDQFAQHLGIELVEWGVGRAIACLQVQPHHLNSVGIVHGGTIFALADLAFAVASNSHGSTALAANATVAYTKAVREGTLTAEAQELALGSRLATYRVEVRDGEGQLVAAFQGTVYRAQRPLPEDGGAAD